MVALEPVTATCPAPVFTSCESPSSPLFSIPGHDTSSSPRKDVRPGTSMQNPVLSIALERDTEQQKYLVHHLGQWVKCTFSEAKNYADLGFTIFDEETWRIKQFEYISSNSSEEKRDAKGQSEQGVETDDGPRSGRRGKLSEDDDFPPAFRFQIDHMDEVRDRVEEWINGRYGFMDVGGEDEMAGRGEGEQEGES